MAFLSGNASRQSVGIPIVSGFVQWVAGVSVPVNLGVNIGGGLLLYTLLVFVERYVRTWQVLEERAEEYKNLIAQ